MEPSGEEQEDKSKADWEALKEQGNEGKLVPVQEPGKEGGNEGDHKEGQVPGKDGGNQEDHKEGQVPGKDGGNQGDHKKRQVPGKEGDRQGDHKEGQVPEKGLQQPAALEVPKVQPIAGQKPSKGGKGKGVGGAQAVRRLATL